jgi:peptidoglycan-N-acetylglucosamine deacetylase
MNLTWPKGYNMALCLSFDIDAETLWLTRNPINQHHPVHISRGRYAVKQGIPRILRMLEGEGVHATFFTPAYIAEIHPDVIGDIARQGHEVAYHGYMHEVKKTYEDENALMEKAESIIERVTGRRPVGDRAPDGFLYDFHLQLWRDRGYIYSSNWRNTDRPFIHELNGQPIPLVELPKDSIHDDTSYDMYTIQHPEHYYLTSGREMVQIWEEELDGILEEKGFMNFVMHPQFIGHPGYVRALREFVRYAKDHKVWIATDEEVARYLLAQNGFPEYAEK